MDGLLKGIQEKIQEETLNKHTHKKLWKINSNILDLHNIWLNLLNSIQNKNQKKYIIKLTLS
jgi:hypothetical protein